MTDEKRLHIKNLTVKIMTEKGVGEAVRGLNLDLRPGEIRGIVGESGCGKSVTAKSILKLHDNEHTEYSGEVIYKGKNILDLSEKEMRGIRGNDIAYIFQHSMSAFDNLFTVGQQICEMIRLHTGCNKQEAWEKCISLLDAVGVTPAEKRAKQYPYEFSGGMLQRAMIAMMISADPEILIADEATTALDVTMQARVLEILKKIRDEKNISILCITHNFGVVAEICDSVTVMFGGFVVECGLVDEIFHKPLHPYTEHLINNLKKGYEVNKDDNIESLPKAQGKPYDITEKRVGCVYQDRCKYATDLCRRQAPPVLGDYEGHGYVCNYTPEEREAMLLNKQA